ncbi:Uncharacterised protein [Clostridioides difficile]|nr:Uncharacterised protein [Clostridioides difficile]
MTAHGIEESIPRWRRPRTHRRCGRPAANAARVVTPSTASATTTVGDTTEVDRPASCEQILTALLHAHEGTTESIGPPTAGVVWRPHPRQLSELLRVCSGDPQKRSGRTAAGPESPTSWTSPPKLSARSAATSQAMGSRGSVMLNRSRTAARMSGAISASTWRSGPV